MLRKSLPSHEYPRVASTLALLFALALTGCTSSGESGRAGRSAAEPGASRSAAERLRADVAWLADDARQGRRAGTPGERASALFIAQRFRDLGLVPAGSDGYLQAFEGPLPARDLGGSSVEVEGRRFVGASSVQPLSCSSAGDVEGPVVFRGYGLVLDEPAWNEHAAGDAPGAVFLLVRGTPPDVGARGEDGAADAKPDPDAAGGRHGADIGRESGPSFAGRGSLFTKAMNAKRRGAAAVIVAPHPDSADEALPAFDPSRSAYANLPCLAVDLETAKALFPEYERAVRALDAAALSGAGPPAQLPLSTRTSLHAAVERARGTATNVLALVRGTAGGDDDRVVVVGAHFDHLGLGDAGSLAPEELGEVHNGADDNASGTAVVLELARELSLRPPTHDVLLALWSGEELGLLGSEYWAEHPTVPLSRLRVNLNLDMVGRAGGNELQVLGAGSAARLAEWLERAGQASGLELEVALSGQGMGGSDHQSFLKRDVSALHFFSGIHTDYHRPSDDVERFEPEGAARVATLVHELLGPIQDASEWAFVAPPAPESQQGVTSGGFRARFGSIPSYTWDGVGVRIDGTSPDSPAEKAGLIAGDVLLGLGDVEIANIYDFVHALQTYKPGDTVRVRYERDGVLESTPVTLAAGRSDE